LKYKKIM